MKIVKQFHEFIKQGIVKKQIPDKSRALFLKEESKKSFLFLEDIVKNFGITDQNASTIIKLSYDVLMERIRSHMIMHGLNASGKGAHEAEVSYLRTMEMSENVVQFANELRYFRNGIMYYEKQMDAEYAQKVWEFLKKIYPKLEI